MITKFNKKGYVFDIDLKKVTTWKKAKDMIGQTIRLQAIGTHKSKDTRYGESCFMITDTGIGINLPSWYADTIREILDDAESVDEIKTGKVLVKFTEYKTKNGASVGVEYMESVDADTCTNDDLPF